MPTVATAMAEGDTSSTAIQTISNRRQKIEVCQSIPKVFPVNITSYKLHPCHGLNLKIILSIKITMPITFSHYVTQAYPLKMHRKPINPRSSGVNQVTQSCLHVFFYQKYLRGTLVRRFLFWYHFNSSSQHLSWTSSQRMIPF
jgi:hypothetical protein